MNPPEDINGYKPLLTAQDCEWNGEAAANAVEFFSDFLKHPDDSPSTKSGSPFKLRPWQVDYIATLFGWFRKEDGGYRYRESDLFIPRKNGKSTIGAGIMLRKIMCDGKTAAQYYSAAETRDQASLLFNMAARMIRMEPDLSKYLKVIDSTKRITFQRNGSYYRVVPNEAGAFHGAKPAAIAFDELHLQKNRRTWDAAKTAFGSTTDPLLLAMSTAGFDRHSVCFEAWELARKVRDGLLPIDYVLPCIYELPEGAAWDDEDVWHKVNPNLGVTISLEFLRDECRRAKEQPAYENTFRNLYLNQWVEQSVRWIPMEKWHACAVSEVDLTGAQCWAGLDLSTTTDITALALAFRLSDGRVYLLPHFWVPRENARKRERRDRVPYQLWGQQGFVTLTDGDVVDYDVVRRDINALHERYNIREIAVDRWNAAQITTQLQGDGFEIHPHGQGYASMSPAAKEFEKLVFGGQLAHPKNPVLDWMASNVAVEQDAAGNLKPSKKVSTERIDGIVAAVMAVGRLVSAEGPSVYETRGIINLTEGEPEPVKQAVGPDWFNDERFDEED